MQVSELIQTLKDEYAPDEHVAVIWFGKDEFDVEVGHELPELSWAGICETFEQDETLEHHVVSYLQEKVYDNTRLASDW